MSHAATNWAIQQRGLAPATKLVLWYLADRHNPDYGCYPSQEQLAHDCEMSRASVNRHLDELEARGLIRRERRLDPQTRRQRPTRYRLAFEPGFALDPDPESTSEPCPEMRHGPGTEDEQPAVPCLNLRHGDDPSRVSNPGGSVSHSCATLTSKGTSKRKEEEEERASAREIPVNGQGLGPEPSPTAAPVADADGAEAEASTNPDPDAFVALLHRVLLAVGHQPDVWVPAWWRGPEAEAHVGRWAAALGEDRVLELARASRAVNPEPPDGPKALDRLMEREIGRRTRAAAKGPGARSSVPAGRDGAVSAGAGASVGTASDSVELFGRRIAEGHYVAPVAVTPRIAREIVARGLVSADVMQRRGFVL